MMGVMRFRAVLIALCLTLLGAAEAARAFEVTSGLSGYQVIQRGPDGTGSVVLSGRTGSAGELKLRLSMSGSTVLGFDGRTVATISPGDWSTPLEDLPTGGTDSRQPDESSRAREH